MNSSMARIVRLARRPSLLQCWAPRRFASTSEAASVHLTFIDIIGNDVHVTAKEGETLMQVAKEHDVGVEGTCGGKMECTTCHLVLEQPLYDKLLPVSEGESDMLDMTMGGRTETSRLGCQIKVTKELEGATLRVPDDAPNPWGYAK